MSPNAVDEPHQPLVPLGHGAAQLVAVYVDVIEQALEVFLAVAALGGVLDGVEDGLQRLIQVFVLRSPLAEVGKQLAGQDEKALGGDQVLPGLLCVGVGQVGIVEIGGAGLPLSLVHIV